VPGEKADGSAREIASHNEVGRITERGLEAEFFRPGQSFDFVKSGASDDSDGGCCFSVVAHGPAS
jgi:hypothetical protein